MRSMTSFAPSRRSASPADAASRTSAVTVAPLSRASWMAIRPTPPVAPVISTRRPSTRPARSSERNAVSPAVGSAAAWASGTSSGTAASALVATAAYSAQAPPRRRPTTRVPACGPLPSSAGRSTTPARSDPGIKPAGRRARSRTSPRLSDTARTRTSACSVSGIGSGASPSTTYGATPVVVSASTVSPVVLVRMQVEHEQDRGLGRGRVERGAERRALQDDTQDGRPEGARLDGGRGHEGPAAAGEVLLDRARPLGVQALERALDGPGQLGPPAGEEHRLDEAQQRGRVGSGVDDRADVGELRARPRPGPLHLGGGAQHVAARRLDEQGLLGAEVVRDLAREGVRAVRDLGQRDVRKAGGREQRARRVEQLRAALAPRLTRRARRVTRRRTVVVGGGGRGRHGVSVAA